MPYYIVKEREQLADILHTQAPPGVSLQDVLSAPENQELFKTRSAVVLGTGDPVFIPEPSEPPSPVTLKTGTLHSLVVDIQPSVFRLRLRQPDQSPIAEAEFLLEAGEYRAHGKTDADGMLEVSLPAGTKEVVLRVGNVAETLAIGALEPAHWPIGLQARLANLGYSPGPVDGAVSTRTCAAIKAFQLAEGLTVTGYADPDTVSKLKTVYGC